MWNWIQRKTAKWKPYSETIMSTKIVGSTDVGTPESSLSEKQTLCFTFHHFGSLPDKRTQSAEPLTCHGIQWHFRIYPKGYTERAEENGFVSVFLKCIVDENNTTGHRVKFWVRTESKTKVSSRDFSSSSSSKGWDQFASRDSIIEHDLAKDGSVTFYVDIQVFLPRPIPWKPQKQLNKQIKRLVATGHGADIDFSVQGTQFSAHKLIVGLQSPTLLDMVDEHSDEKVVLHNVDPRLFKLFLAFIYIEELPATFDYKCDGLKLLEVADRFGCTNLKLFVEAELVSSGVAVDDAANYFVFADSHSCALLKEASLDTLVAHREVSLKTAGWKTLQESGTLVAEVLAHCFAREKQDGAGGLEQATVTDLRNQLEELEEDVDGSKETLIARLRRVSNKN